MKKETIIIIITIALLALWVPVVIDKLTEFKNFQIGMLKQPLPKALLNVLVWGLPFLELATIVLLIMNSTRIWGMYLSFFLMVLFTGYIWLTLLGAWERVGCSCGSVISRLSWQQHFWFNVFFTLVSAAGIYFMKLNRNSEREFLLGRAGQPHD